MFDGTTVAVVVVVVVLLVAVAATTTTTTASATTPWDHDWRSLMLRRATSATSLPDSVWQRVAPSKFGTASNTVLAEDARGQQASKLHVEPSSFDPASLVQQKDKQ
jgi:hypothetical protein